MIIRTQMNDTKLAECLQACGYETEVRDVPVAVTRRHNDTEIENYPRLHVRLNGEWKEAHPFFEKLLDESLIYMLKSYTAQVKLNII